MLINNSKIETYKEALNYIMDFSIKKEWWHEVMIKCAEKLWDPQNNFKIIHIAGTNGKGSVCKMVYSILQKNWISTWCYTSPHILDIRERFLVSWNMITESELIAICNTIKELNVPLTYGQKCVLIALVFFAEQNVEFWIIEVWMGGKNDTTNFISSHITAITSISYDHINSLGSTLEEISDHKSGIIKEWIPIVYNHINSVIEWAARKKNAPIIFTKKSVETNLVWEYQKLNAWIAFEICTYLWCTDQTIVSWLQNVQHLGRLQYISSNVLIDWAHNADWLKELKKYLDSIKNNYNEIILCIGQKKWKNGEHIIQTFYPEFNNYILVISNNASIVEDSRILSVKLIQQQNKLKINYKTPEIIKQVAKNNPNTLYVVFGSLYMIGEFYH